MMYVTRSRPQELYRNIVACRICGDTNLAEGISLGPQFLSTTFVQTNEGHPLSDAKVPLTLLLCDGCHTLQLKESVDRTSLYDDYSYRISANPAKRTVLKELVADVTGRVEIGKGDAVLDIGANDGTLLSYYPTKVRQIGVEPAENISWSHLDRSIAIINGTFSESAIRPVLGQGQVKIITSVAMLSEVNDLHAFAKDVKALLAKDGVWCIQVSYLPQLLDTLTFHEFCHDHLYYFSLMTLNSLLEENGLSIFDVSLNKTSGGSIRAFASHRESVPEKTEAFHNLLQSEATLGLDEPETYAAFHQRLLKLKTTIKSFIRQEHEAGYTIGGLGASSKANVMLQFFDIDKHVLPYISERNPDKVSLRTLGTDIELVSEHRARQLKPDVMMVLPWHLKSELMRREKRYLENGGKLLFPMPYPHIVTRCGETLL
ncbi:MAG: hypothetical protein BZY79_05485 [SAR202 cluster bacterium Casp-Chloro-G4]|nr:class I SAM-dependent methyltransferase [Chloroflexota bacterium]MDA1227277.1 class I SAM-dependent methyltransferase [Chloroflexota bacterium]PKB61097.1 MAG: hypothetical protein BZY79_05485 [SAR202 cluster bacterium Casp-Chloro-G4]